TDSRLFPSGFDTGLSQAVRATAFQIEVIPVRVRAGPAAQPRHQMTLLGVEPGQRDLMAVQVHVNVRTFHLSALDKLDVAREAQINARLRETHARVTQQGTQAPESRARQGKRVLLGKIGYPFSGIATLIPAPLKLERPRPAGELVEPALSHFQAL